MPEVEQEYANKQMKLIVDELNVMQTKYDTRMLAALLAGRAAMLHSVLVNGKVITKDEALLIWNKAGEVIEEDRDNEVKFMYKDGDEIFDAPTTKEIN